MGIDISRLDVCFGGFSPTVMGDLTASWEKAVEAETRIAERKEAALLAARLEAARESEPLVWKDATGTVWDYVLLDGADVRIKGCHPETAVLTVPSSIEGHPVVEIAADGCSFLKAVTDVVVPDSVVTLGDCAFRGCLDLRSVTLPSLVSEFSADWFRNCKKLECLTLPGALEVLTPRIFDHGSLKALVIGEGTRDVQPGTFMNSHLQSIQVRPENPFMGSDGYALYSKEGSLMAALAVPLESYELQKGCRALGKKAMSTFRELEAVSLPESLEVIGAFAFAGTSLRSFTAPARLRVIQDKAFYGCSKLERVLLNPGLELIGASAFEDTGISELRIPSTVREIGPRVADGTNVTFSGADASFSIEGCDVSESSARGHVSSGEGELLFDGCGGLYKVLDEGLYFVRLMDPDATEYDVLEGTLELGRQAFECARRLKRVHLPEGLRRVEGAAFRGCMELEHVSLPETVTWIGGDAFLDTLIDEVTLSRDLEHLGPRALVTLGAHHGSGAPSLHRIDLKEGSAKFRMHEGMLLERKEDGAERVVIYVGPHEVVHVPESVDEIAAYAFNGTTQIKELFLSDRITTVKPRGLAVDRLLEHIHVDMREPVEGHEAFDIFPPRTDRSEQQMMLALTVPTFVNVEALFEYYDNSIINASSFDALSESGLGTYEQAVRLIARLQDPIFMSPVSQDMAKRILRNGLAAICLEMARHDDRASLTHLIELGVLDRSNVDEAIDAVQSMQDASMTGYLLEAKRKHFGGCSFDFSL